MFEAADIISSYSRAQAVEDGELVDVTEVAREAGFRHPAAITRSVWTEIKRGNGRHEAHEQGRLWDVLWMAARAASRVAHGRPRFRVKIGARVHLLVLDCGPGDHAEPVLTIGKPEDF